MSHLGPRHPVAAVAARLCEAHLGTLRHRLVGQTACGACWERAIRDDERAVVLFDLPREVIPDPSYIDEIAVELACRGEDVALTPAERRVAHQRMRAAERKAAEVSGRGWISSTVARRITPSNVDWKGRPKSPTAVAAQANKDWRAAS